MYHNPVLLKECIEGLKIKPDGTYVDATFGGGGHSKEILKRLENGKLFAFDQDEDAIRNRIEDPRIIMINSNFRYIKNFLRFYKSVPVNGIIADLGISSHQIDEAERGFSIRSEGRLDMRMDRRHDLTAREIVNTYPENQLRRIFQDYGEVRNANQIARLIVSARKDNFFQTTADLKEVIETVSGKGRENKYMAQVFQALRIEVNKELESLKELLINGTRILQQGGRFVILSYHSLEDRIVKNFFRSGNSEGIIIKDFYGNVLLPFKVINRKPIVPSANEIMRNSRARSARMRIAEKI